MSDNNPSQNKADSASHFGDLAGMSGAISDGSLPPPGPTAGAAAPKWLGKRIGRFRLVGVVGRGSWGCVYEAEDTDLRRRVAIKLLPAKDAKGEDADFRRVADEARAAAALEHPNVIGVYEIGKKGDFFYLVMELAEGGSVDELIRAAGPIDAARAGRLCAEAGDALAAAHDCGIVHRDVKPANLLLSRSGRCKVADFGLAAGGDASDPLHATRAAGTAHYVAPEIVRGTAGDERSDVYSLGATLYHMLAGRRPFEGRGGEGRGAILRAQLQQEPPDLASIRPDLDPKLVAVVKRAMSKNPAERFGSMREFARALRLFTVEAADRPATVATPSQRPGPTRMQAIAIAGSAAAAVLVVISLLALRGNDDEKPAAASPTPVVPAPVAPAPAPVAVTPPAPRPVAPSAADKPAPVEFAVDTRHWDEKPHSLAVAGDFNDWRETADPLADPDGDGVWRASVALPPGVHHYKFVVNGQHWINDDNADRSLEVDDRRGGKNSGVRVAVP